MPEPETINLLAVIVVATILRTIFGFGDALIAMPLLSLMFGIRFVSPLVAMISATTSIVVLSRDWRDANLKNVGALILSSFVGIPIGLLALKNFDERLLKTILAVVIILFALHALSGSRRLVLRTDKSAYLFGLGAGMIGGAYNTHGPPLVMYATLREWPPERFRANLQICFLASGLAVLCTHYAGGLWTAQVVDSYLLVLPAILISIFLGRKLATRFHHEQFMRFVHMMLIAIGILLLWQSQR